MRLIDRRLGLLFCAFFLIFSFALVRSFWLQGVKGGTFRAEAHSQQVTTVTIPGERGRVLDRNGKVLAASEDAADVVATPYQVESPGQTAMRLHDVLGVPTSDLLNALSDRSSGFAYLARKVDPNVAAEVKQLNITGISTVPTSKRLYPQGELASQVIGAVGTDNQGLTGLEHSQNSALGGANGEEDIVHDAVGRPLRMETVKPASVGEDVQTTLDAGPAVLAWRRDDDHDRVLAAVNFAPEVVPLGLEPDEGGEATLLLSTDPDRAPGPVVMAELELGPSEAILLRL